MKTERRGQSQVFSAKDWERFRAKLKNPKYRLLATIGYYTGARISAMLQLRWADIEPTEICFRAETLKQTSATPHDLIVPIHPELQIELARSPREGILLFPSPRNFSRPMSRQAADHYLRAKFREAKLTGFSSHSFRRTLITRLDESGTSLKIIQAISGHKDVRNLLRYVDDSPAKKAAAIALL